MSILCLRSFLLAPIALLLSISVEGETWGVRPEDIGLHSVSASLQNVPYNSHASALDKELSLIVQVDHLGPGRIRYTLNGAPQPLQFLSSDAPVALRFPAGGGGAGSCVGSCWKLRFGVAALDGDSCVCANVADVQLHTNHPPAGHQIPAVDISRFLPVFPAIVEDLSVPIQVLTLPKTEYVRVLVNNMQTPTWFTHPGQIKPPGWWMPMNGPTTSAQCINKCSVAGLKYAAVLSTGMEFKCNCGEYSIIQFFQDLSKDYPSSPGAWEIVDVCPQGCSRDEVASNRRPKTTVWSVETTTTSTVETTTTTPTTTRAPRCARGWKRFRDHCYKLFTMKKFYSAARRHCRAQGADIDLVSIHSQAEQNFVQRKFMQRYDGYFWIGLHDHGKEGRFKWWDGTPYDYSNWTRGQPDNLNNSDCVFTFRNGKWDDSTCDHGTVPKRFICKYRLR